MIRVRRVRLDDLPVVAEMMHTHLDPFYGGDHRAHAKRIVETASRGNKDKFGLSWQIVPKNMDELMKKPEAFKIMMGQKKIVIADYE